MKRGKGKGGSGGRSGGGIPERDLNGDTSGGDSGKKKDWRVNKKDVQFNTTLPNRHIRELAFFKKDSHLSHITQQIHHICTRTMVASVPVAIVHHIHRL